MGCRANCNKEAYRDTNGGLMVDGQQGLDPRISGVRAYKAIGGVLQYFIEKVVGVSDILLMTCMHLESVVSPLAWCESQMSALRST